MRLRKPLKITSRTSSITNAFVQAILPRTTPDESEHAQVLAILEIDPESKTCAYCGDPAVHWDHLNPFVSAKRPSGYINNARNLVPACGTCNTSKSGHPWKTWMFGNARNSPKSRKIKDLEVRRDRLLRLESEMALEPLILSQLVDPELWKEYWAKLAAIENMLIEAQAMASTISAEVEARLGGKSS